MSQNVWISCCFAVSALRISNNNFFIIIIIIVDVLAVVSKVCTHHTNMLKCSFAPRASVGADEADIWLFNCRNEDARGNCDKWLGSGVLKVFDRLKITAD